MSEVTQIISARWDQGPKESTSLERSISEVWYAARTIFQFRNHRANEMEQNELLAEAFEPLSLFEVSRFPCRVQNTLSWDTITLGSYWSFPKPDTRLAEHVNNFRVSNLIAHIFEKLTQDSAAERIWSSNSRKVKRDVSNQHSCFPHKEPGDNPLGVNHSSLSTLEPLERLK